MLASPTTYLGNLSEEVPDEGVKITKSLLVNPYDGEVHLQQTDKLLRPRYADSQNSNIALTFHRLPSQESRLSFDSESLFPKSKRVYDVHLNEPFFKLTKFTDLVQLKKYEAKEQARNGEEQPEEQK